MSGISDFFNSSPGSAMLGTAGNVIGSYLGSSNQWKYQKRQNEWSERMMQQQNAWNQQNAAIAYQRQIDFYNMQNDYNSPVNQIARLRSAGINPNLAYANGALNNVGASTPSVSQAETASAPAGSASVSPGSLGTIGSNFVQMYQMGEQNKAIKAQVDKIQKEGQKLDFDNRIRSMTWLDEAQSLQHSYRAKHTLEDLADEVLEQARIATKKARVDLSYDSDTLQDRKTLVNIQKDQGTINNELNRCALRVQQARMPYVKKMAYLEWRQAVQNILLMRSQGVLNNASANAAYADATFKLQAAVSEKHKQGLYDSQSDLNDASRFNTLNDAGNKILWNKVTNTEFNFRYPKAGSNLLIQDGRVNVQGIKNTTFQFLNSATDAAKAGAMIMALP